MNLDNIPRKWIFMACLFVTLLLVVWIKTERTRNGYKLERLRQEHKSTTLLLSDLKFEYARMKATDALLKKAKEFDFELPRTDADVKIREIRKK
ncbi:hypothetical protein ACFL6Y_02325 [Elusimicrobiota bacterium]